MKANGAHKETINAKILIFMWMGTQPFYKKLLEPDWRDVMRLDAANIYG